MRKNCARKWLHFVLDLLPVILIPVFMVFSHRHDIGSSTSYTEEVPVYYDTNDVESVDDVINGNYYHWNDNYTFVLGQTQTRFLRLVNDTNIRTQLSISDTYNDCELWFINNNTINQLRIDFMRNNSYVDGLTLSGQEFDFCVMSILNQQVLSSYITYIGECHTLYVKDYQEIIYNFDKNIMGAFMTNFVDTTNTYFNFNRLFNMNDVYEWMNHNLFQDNAPIIVSAIWNIIVYEFFMDIIMLMYATFMFVIDFATDCLDKPFREVKKR